MVNHFGAPPFTPETGGSLLAYAEVLAALSNSSWVRFYDGWLGTTLDNPDQHTGAQLLPGLIQETALGLPVLVHADPRVYAKDASAFDGAAEGYVGALTERPKAAAPYKACDNPMVGKGTISPELKKIQLAAFLLAQGNYTCVLRSQSLRNLFSCRCPAVVVFSLAPPLLLRSHCLDPVSGSKQSRGATGLAAVVSWRPTLAVAAQVLCAVGGLDRRAAAPYLEGPSPQPVGVAARVRLGVRRAARGGGGDQPDRR